ncbi:MAG: hypothetical protein H5T50_07780 [Nitrososphaeria archaeon]|nr:hypothetical protein [Nitrososphaeria archaeon]
MVNIKLSIPDELYKKMKKYSENKWNEVVGKAISDYINIIKEKGSKVSTKELLKSFNKEFREEFFGCNI